MLKALKTIPISSFALKLLTKTTPHNHQFSSLVSMSLSNALHPFYSQNLHNPFDEIPRRTLFISQTLNLLKQNPSELPLTSRAHSLTLKTNAFADISIRTSLLTAYGRASDLDSSLALFSEAHSACDLISWNAIINACVLNAQLDLSIDLFKQMVDGLGEFDSTTLVIMLSGMTRVQNLKHGSILHGVVVKRGFERDVYLGNALVNMYAKCGELRRSKLVFGEMDVKNVTS